MQPRDYQIACHDAVLGAWGIPPYHDGVRDVVRSTVANLATSSGKTIIAAMLTATLTENSRSKVLFMADSDELCQQPLDKFRKAKDIRAAVEKAGETASLNSQVVVGSAQTLARTKRRERFPRDHFDYIIVDEAHRGSDRNKTITDYFASAKLLGLTATAFRKKLADLSDFYDDVCFELGVFDLIGQGFITPIKVLTLPLKVDLTKVRKSINFGEPDYNTEDLDKSITPWYEAIAQAILEHAPKRHIVSYLPLIKSSQAFVEVCQGNGINAVHVDGQDPLREKKLMGFARGDWQLLSNSSLLTTGWDCHIADCMLNLRPTQSVGLFRQMAGRFIRVLEGVIDGITDAGERIDAIAHSAKPDALILDLLWQTEKMGLVGPASLIADTEEDAREIQKRLRTSKETETLADVSAAVRIEKEEQLRQELERQAARHLILMDARELALMFHEPKLIDFEPVAKWERKHVTPKQAEYLESLGIDPETVKNAGHAGAVLTKVLNREQQGLAALQAIKPLRAAGVEHPERMSLDDAIRTLGAQYPMTFGKKHRATPDRYVPLSAVPAGYWVWMQEASTRGEMREAQKRHIAAFRYMRKVLQLQREAEPVAY